MFSETRSIDLNLDAGEDPSMLADGREAALYDLVSSVNIACGGHAGDEASMRAALRLALARSLAIGAHPSYPDKAGFGRDKLELESSALTEALVSQLRALQKCASIEGARLTHVKPHGALYNVAATDEPTALAFLEAVHQADRSLAIVGLAGSSLARLARSKGFRFLGEAFVDRRYEANATLRPRRFANALITKPEEASAQAAMLLCEKRVRSHDGKSVAVAAETLCIHGDSPGAYEVARAVRTAIEKLGFKIAAPRA